jgi:tRNA U34 5-carboxymethylaminomethyl modifying enzyme MnmG/GidA
MRKYESVEKYNTFFADASVKPENVNQYLNEVGSAEINSRKRIADLISRPQTNIHSLFNYVPRGTFSKFNIDNEAELTSSLKTILKDGVEYSNLVEYAPRQELNEKFITDAHISYKDAASVLMYNTDYPIVKLNASDLNDKIEENYKREVLDSSEIAIKYKGYIQREQQMADKIMRLENLIIPEDFDFDRVESLSIECRQKLKKYAPRTIAQASRISGVSPADISVLLVYFGR